MYRRWQCIRGMFVTMHKTNRHLLYFTFLVSTRGRPVKLRQTVAVIGKVKNCETCNLSAVDNM